MTKQIWKFALDIADAQQILMPQAAQILSIGVQQAQPRIWALVDVDAPQVYRIIRVFGTGDTLVDSPGDFIGTFQMHDGFLVYHVFDQGEGGGGYIKRSALGG